MIKWRLHNFVNQSTLPDNSVQCKVKKKLSEVQMFDHKLHMLRLNELWCDSYTFIILYCFTWLRFFFKVLPGKDPWSNLSFKQFYKGCFGSKKSTLLTLLNNARNQSKTSSYYWLFTILLKINDVQTSTIIGSNLFLQNRLLKTYVIL